MASITPEDAYRRRTGTRGNVVSVQGAAMPRQAMPRGSRTSPRPPAPAPVPPGDMEPPPSGPPPSGPYNPDDSVDSYRTMMEGYDWGKFDDAGHSSPKYQIGRVLQKFDPRKGITSDVLSALNALGIGTFSGERDWLRVGGEYDPRFENTLEADIIRNFTSDDGSAPAWLGWGGNGGGMPPDAGGPPPLQVPAMPPWWTMLPQPQPPPPGPTTGYGDTPTLPPIVVNMPDQTAAPLPSFQADQFPAWWMNATPESGGGGVQPLVSGSPAAAAPMPTDPALLRLMQLLGLLPGA